MAMEVNDSNFKEEALGADLPVLVDFWAPWCSPCQKLASLIGEIAGEYQGRLKVCKLNVDDSPSTASGYEIMSIPTLIIFQGGEVRERIIGLVSKSELEAKIKPYLEE
ncbi:thioredoxin [candidate division NPL-UPA2 bacterium]|nr:thioredoxin [candidate division NPL-UPA2 bacterium]